MDGDGASPYLVVRDDPRLYSQLEGLALGRRMVFFAGLPGTGKSLLIHQLAHLAHRAGRTIHLLQWDVVRPRFESCEAGRRYPILGGVSHIVVRKAVGAWARQAVVRWHADHPDPKDLLIGETPLVGHRFVELARRMDDPAEPLLTAASCRFVIPVPSRDVRQFLEDERDRRIHRPAHDREREDAPPDVIRALWVQLIDVAYALGVEATRPPGRTPPPYDPALYERVYRAVLTHRHAQTLVVETRLRSAAFSAYQFALPTHELVPPSPEADRVIVAVERRYPDLSTLREEVTRWYVV